MCLRRGSHLPTSVSPHPISNCSRTCSIPSSSPFKCPESKQEQSFSLNTESLYPTLTLMGWNHSSASSCLVIFVFLDFPSSIPLLLPNPVIFSSKKCPRYALATFFRHHLDWRTQAGTPVWSPDYLSNPSFESTTPMSLFITLFLQCHSHAQNLALLRKINQRTAIAWFSWNEVPGRAESIKMKENGTAGNWGQEGMES